MFEHGLVQALESPEPCRRMRWAEDDRDVSGSHRACVVAAGVHDGLSRCYERIGRDLSDALPNSAKAHIIEAVAGHVLHVADVPIQQALPPVSIMYCAHSTATACLHGVGPSPSPRHARMQARA